MSWNRLYLTPLDQQILDPTGKARAHISKLQSSKYRYTRPDDKYILKADRYFERLSIPKCSAHQLYYDFNKKYLGKVGPQGGSYPFQVLMDSLRAYYPTEITAKPNYALVGLQYIVRLIGQLKSMFGSIYKYTTTSITGTCSGLPWMRKKSLPQFCRCYSPISSLSFKLLPAIPGMRKLKNGNRVIFMDAEENVRRYEKLGSLVRQWLREHLPWFSGWLNPDKGLRENATKIIDKRMVNIELDAKKMDQHFSESLTYQLVCPVFEALLDEIDYLYFMRYVDQMYKQPLYLGDSVLTGTHTLFSGQGPTNDFETIYDVVVAVGITLSFHIPIDEIIILANGDDVTYAYPRKYIHLHERIYAAFLEEYEANGIEVSREKSRDNTPDVQFCKKVYYQKGIRNEEGILLGAYPSILTLNSIVYPEHEPKSEGQRAVRILQILDNLIGSPDYNDVLQIVYSVEKDSILHFTDEDIACVTDADWWYRVYGERWSPSASPSYNKLKKFSSK